MDLTLAGPIDLAQSRLAWLDARQRILARNVANADMPGFRPSDAVPFGDVLRGRLPGPAMAVTDVRHLAPRQHAALAVQDRQVVERSRNGNAVSLDDEAIRLAETDQAQALAVGLHRKYLGLFRTALGR